MGDWDAIERAARLQEMMTYVVLENHRHMYFDKEETLRRVTGCLHGLEIDSSCARITCKLPSFYDRSVANAMAQENEALSDSVRITTAQLDLGLFRPDSVALLLGPVVRGVMLQSGCFDKKQLVSLVVQQTSSAESKVPSSTDQPQRGKNSALHLVSVKGDRLNVSSGAPGDASIYGLLPAVGSDTFQSGEPPLSRFLSGFYFELSAFDEIELAKNDVSSERSRVRQLQPAIKRLLTRGHRTGRWEKAYRTRPLIPFCDDVRMYAAEKNRCEIVCFLTSNLPQSSMDEEIRKKRKMAIDTLQEGSKDVGDSLMQSNSPLNLPLDKSDWWGTTTPSAVKEAFAKQCSSQLLMASESSPAGLALTFVAIKTKSM